MDSTKGKQLQVGIVWAKMEIVLRTAIISTCSIYIND